MKDVTTIQIRQTTRKKLRVATSYLDETYDEWILRKAEEEIEAHNLKAGYLNTRWQKDKPTDK